MALRRATGVWIEQRVRWMPDAEDRPGLETVTIPLLEEYAVGSGEYVEEWVAVLPEDTVMIEWFTTGEDRHAIEVLASTYKHWHVQQAREPVQISKGPHSAEVFAVRYVTANNRMIEGQALWWWQGEFYWAPVGTTAVTVAARAADARSYVSTVQATAEAAKQKAEREKQARRAAAREAQRTRQSLYEVDGYKLERRHGIPWSWWNFYLTVRLSSKFLGHSSSLGHPVPQECSVRLDRSTYERLAEPVTGTAESMWLDSQTAIWFIDGKAYSTQENLDASDVEAAIRDDALSFDPETPSEPTLEAPPGETIWYERLWVHVNEDGVGVHWSCAGRRGGRRRQCEEPDATVKATVYGELERLRSTAPMLLARDEHGGRTLWWYRDGYWWDDEGLSAEEIGLLLWDRERKRDARFDRLRKISAREEDLAATRRERIPDEVRAFVWERDEGRCVRCGAEDDLQFDHVIPVAKGGGVAADNIQILCGDCNRAKSDSIA